MLPCIMTQKMTAQAAWLKLIRRHYGSPSFEGAIPIFYLHQCFIRPLKPWMLSFSTLHLSQIPEMAAQTKPRVLVRLAQVDRYQDTYDLSPSCSRGISVGTADFQRSLKEMQLSDMDFNPSRSIRKVVRKNIISAISSTWTKSALFGNKKKKKPCHICHSHLICFLSQIKNYNDC